MGVTRLAAKSSGFTCHVWDLQQSLMVNGFAPPVCKIDDEEMEEEFDIDSEDNDEH